MGTRGLMGFVVDGQVKAGYNHYDSYPSALGLTVGQFAARLTGDRLAEVTGLARALVLVEDDDQGTAYDRLRDTQGDPAETLKAGEILDYADFAYDSLFCEWAYLLNLDTGVIEVYRGFQKDAGAIKGRFATDKVNNGYAAITLLGTLPFTLGDSAAFWTALEEAVYAEEDPQPVFAEAAITAAPCAACGGDASDDQHDSQNCWVGQ